MRFFNTLLAAGIVSGLLVVGSALADSSDGQRGYGHGDETKPPGGVIGISLQIGAEQIGDPAILLIGRVHPEGPAQRAGLRHGDEVVSVDGTAVTGKSYKQVVSMIRGEAGISVSLGVRAENGLREVSVTRVASDKLPRGSGSSHGNPAR
ncbi:MAG TPA: PDZ domain-containing protein [Nitrospira sp.]|nr:PDZ domain-containing protein [Nitrospira sp.]